MACPTVVFGNPQNVSTNGASYAFLMQTIALPSSDGKFVQLYVDFTSGATAVVGQVDEDGDITYGTPVGFESDFGGGSAVAVSSTKIVCAYRDTANDPTSIVGTISGMSISFGSPQNVDTLYPYSNAISVDPSTGKLLWIYSVIGGTKTIAGDVSGTAVTWGTATEWKAERRRSDVSVLGIGSNKFIYTDSGPTNTAGYAFIFTVSGTTVTDGSEHQFSTTRASAVDLAYDHLNDVVMCVYDDNAPNNFQKKGIILTVSGTTVGSGSKYQVCNDQITADLAIGFGHGVAFDSVSERFVVFFRVVDSATDDPIGAKSGSVTGTVIDFCPSEDPALVAELPPYGNADDGGIAFTDNGYSVCAWNEDGDTLRNISIELTIPVIYACTIKPKLDVIDVEGVPGSPYFPGQAYIPPYCVQSPGCTDQQNLVQADSAGGFIERKCWEKDGFLVCITIYTSGTDIANPGEVFDANGAYDPNYNSDLIYDPSYNPYNPFGDPGFGVDSNDAQVCIPPVCYPAQPYIPPSPAITPTPTQWSIDYQLGWNYDVLIGTGSNITISIDSTIVGNATSGIAIGVSNLEDWALSGLGKLKVFLLLEGSQASVWKEGVKVWGQTYRALTDIYSIQQYGEQVAFFRNDAEIFKADVMSGGPVAMGAILYKGGDAICLPAPGETPLPTPTAGPIGSGDADILLPAFGVLAYEGDYAVGDVVLPAFGSSGSAGNHGYATANLPPLFAIGSEGSFGYSFIDLPVIEVTGYVNSALDGYATITLPVPSVVGADTSGYGFGDIDLPLLTVSGSGNFAIPVAEGADITLPKLIFGAVGTTGTIGGLTPGDLPAFGALSADRPYGEARTDLPVPWLFAGDLPVYDGVISGWFEPLEMTQGYGSEIPLNTLDGNLSALSGELHSGAHLDQNISILEGELTGDIGVVGRIDGDFLPMQMNSTGLAGLYGEIDGTLGSPLIGELWGGASLRGDIKSLSGGATGTNGAVGVLFGSFQDLDGTLSGTVHQVGILIGDLPALEPLWGIINGDLPAMTGSISETLLTVQEYVAWIMNISNSSVSKYPDFAFDFACRWRGNNYVVRSDGVYLFGGELDSGQPIDAGFTLPPTDMGISTEKISPRLYLQGRLDGQFAVTSQADEKDPVRSVSVIRPGTGYYRCKLPRGIRGTYLEFDVDNVSGSDFEIEQVDALVADTGRKI